MKWQYDKEDTTVITMWSIYTHSCGVFFVSLFLCCCCFKSLFCVHVMFDTMIAHANGIASHYLWHIEKFSMGRNEYEYIKFMMFMNPYKSQESKWRKYQNKCHMGRSLIYIHTCVKVFANHNEIYNICSHVSQLMGCTHVLSKTHRPVAWLVCGCHSYKLHWDLLVHSWWISCPYTLLHIKKKELKGPEQQVVWATTYCRIYMLNMPHWIGKGLWNTISIGHNQLLKRI